MNVSPTDSKASLGDIEAKDKLEEQNVAEEFVPDPVFEKKLLRKLDWHLMPIISVMFMLSFLDRANIGNAFAAGMIKDLKLTGLRSNIASAVFYITYATFEVPANMMLKLFRPSRWIPSMMLAWGTVLALMCLLSSYEGLVVARLALGLAETGMFPGALYYTSLWYPKKALAVRVAIYFSVAITGVAFGGILAYFVQKMEGVGGLHGWAWIFGLEGMATVVMAGVAFFTVQDYPETCTFLTPQERTYLVSRLQADRLNTSTAFDWKFVRQAFGDVKIYLMALIYAGFLVPTYALALFLPTIISALGYGDAKAQLLTVPPYIIALPLSIGTSIISDKYLIRGPFVLLYSFISIVGFSILLGTRGSSPAAGYVGAVLGTIGAVGPVPTLLAWIGNNLSGDLKRGVGYALVLGSCNLLGIVAGFTYRMVNAPQYVTGHSIVLGFLCTSFILILFAMLMYNRINRYRSEKCRREGINESRAEEFTDLGDASPLFRYTL